MSEKAYCYKCLDRHCENCMYPRLHPNLYNEYLSYKKRNEFRDRKIRKARAKEILQQLVKKLKTKKNILVRLKNALEGCDTVEINKILREAEKRLYHSFCSMFKCYFCNEPSYVKIGHTMNFACKECWNRINALLITATLKHRNCPMEQCQHSLVLSVPNIRKTLMYPIGDSGDYARFLTLEMMY